MAVIWCLLVCLGIAGGLQNVDDDGDGGVGGQSDQISDVADVLFHCRCSSLWDVYFKSENLRSVCVQQAPAAVLRRRAHIFTIRMAAAVISIGCSSLSCRRGPWLTF